MARSAFAPAEALLFFNNADAATVEAFASQIIPSEEGSPGAREAGVVYYIDRALAGFMRDLQPLYRRGLEALADLAIGAFGLGFSALDDAAQRSLVESLDERAAAEPDDFAGQFYRILREHTVQGFFGDPAYGGNREVVGWKLVGFPGAQWGYTRDQMQSGVDARSIPILTIGDLYTRIGANRT
jgi:gluconate 2-dehydrogenase gamma chain